jgi:ribulose-phosphate 3-epimerase
MSNIVAPSLLSSDFSRIKEEAIYLNESNADWFHLDVMDGIFVPNISFGLPIIEAFRKHTEKILDVHAMIAKPDAYLSDFKKAGADILTIHYEACTHLHRTVDAIKQLDMQAGVALNPHTPVSLLEDILPYLDLVLIMSVNPGFGGQSFIPQTYRKIEALREMIDDQGLDVMIEVDGGVTLENAPQLVAAGADALVAGSTVYRSADPKATINALKYAGH